MKTEYDIVSERNSAECIKIVNQKLSEDWRVVGGVWYGGEYDPVAQAMTRDIPDAPEKTEDMNSRPFSKEFVRGYNAHDDDAKKPAPTPEQMFEAVCKTLVQSMRKRSLSFISCATLNRTAYNPPPDLITSLKAELDRIQDRDLRLARIQERDSC